MTRDEFAEGINLTCALIDEPRIVVFGSQAILGSFAEGELPPAATLSREMDAASARCVELGVDDPDKRNLIASHLGEMTAFHQARGWYVDGIDPLLPTLPTGWENRLVRYDVRPDTEDHYGRSAFCIEPVDLCVGKLLVFRDKDRSFVAELVRNGNVALDEVDLRLNSKIAWSPQFPPKTRPQALRNARSFIDWLR